MEVIILSAGFVGLVIAALTPRYMLGGTLALACFGIYFTLNGSGEWLPVVLFILGVMLLIFEVLIPDFGVAGALGVLLLILGVYMTHGDLGRTLTELGIGFVVAIVIAILLIREGYSFENLNRLVLKSNLDKVSGYSSSKDRSEYIGQTGVTTTYLRPSGRAKFADEELDVISNGEHVEDGVDVIVTKVEGYKIIVRRVEER